MDNKETAEHFRSRSSEVPLWHRQNISVEEASGYTGLGRDTIYSLTQEDDCDFVLKVGHRTMIKRKKVRELFGKPFVDIGGALGVKSY